MFIDLMKVVSFIFTSTFLLMSNGFAAQPQPSTCYATAQQFDDDFARVQFAGFSATSTASQSNYEVAISYEGHSTYLIETGAGVRIATDYAGFTLSGVLPDVVTMNQAHSSHYTNFPDPKIAHVLRGWGQDGEIAKHYLTVKDVLIRNVTTDILRGIGVPDGNSIFIFEVAGLCIGHLGHLHHQLSESQFAQIGRLDVVMIPVDGGLTLTHTSARLLLERLRSSVILPMHVRFAGALPRFLAHLGDAFNVEQVKENKLVLSLRNLPQRPTVMILPGVSSYPVYDE